MKITRQKTKRIVSCILLILYLVFLFWKFIGSQPVNPNNQIRFTLFHLYDEYIVDSYRSYLLFDVIRKVFSMIPVGIFFPMVIQKRCLPKTLAFGSVVSFLCEIIQLRYHKEVVCFDDILLAMIGIYIGYEIFIYLCEKASDGFHYLYLYDRMKGISSAACLVIIFLFFYIFTKVPFPDFLPFHGYSVSQNSSVSDKDIVYQTFYSEIMSYKTVINVRVFDKGENVNDQLHKVLDDHPEIFWLSGGGKVLQSSQGYFPSYTYSLNSVKDMKEVPAKVEELNNVIDEITAEAEKLSTDYEKALYVHDWIVRNCDYDTNTYYYITADEDADIKNYSPTAYGCLVEHKAICQGYAKAYQLLLTKLGIECGFVFGTATNDTGTDSHAWNYIKLDDGYYLVDVTWDDPVFFDSGANVGLTNAAGAKNICHDYFCLSTYEMEKDHTIDEGLKIPACVGLKY